MNLKTRLIYYLIWITATPFLMLSLFGEWVAGISTDFFLDRLNPEELGAIGVTLDQFLAHCDAQIERLENKRGG